MEDEFKTVIGAGMRTYADFARRTPIPARNDGKTTTTRNTMQLVNASIARPNFLYHFDGEFADAVALTQGAFTGRNFGWLASESAIAIKHIGNVIRNDNGTGALAQAYGGSYAKVFAADPSVPADLRLPPAFQLNVATATDQQILTALGNLVNVYLENLVFSKDSAGNYNGSPYDVFLAKNKLPRQPNAGESNLAYSRRLRAALAALKQPLFVGPADGQFVLHQIPFAFGPEELQGLTWFLNEPAAPLQKSVGKTTKRITRALPPPPPPPPASVGIGNCIACHAAPDFSDQLFHTTGVTQLEYEHFHGPGSFMNLAIPNLAQRTANPAAYLPATAAHPSYLGTFRSVPSPSTPGFTDLGMWNIYQNPDMPASQPALTAITRNLFGALSAASTLDKTVASFKTPGLRDLFDSNPYFHDGSRDTFVDVLDFYLQVSQMARTGQLRNADPELSRIQLNPVQAGQVARFLTSLTEDFQD